MEPMESKKHVLPHTGFREISKNLWILEGSLPHNNPLPRNMVVYRRKNGKLWIHGPVAIDRTRQNFLESLGEPEYIVIPNSMHRLDARVYKDTYPNAEVVCPEKAHSKVETKVHVDLIAEQEFIEGDIKAITIPGVNAIECAYELDLESGKALIMNDVLVNLPKLSGFTGALAKVLGRIGFFRSPPLTKLLFHIKKNAFRVWLNELSQRNDIKVVTVAHGYPITQNIPDLFRKASAQM